MIYHVLNGDALVDRFAATGLPGEVVVARECLIEGDLSGDTREAFYRTRAAWFAGAYGEDQQRYFDDVAAEFERLASSPDPSEFNLWFGYDLFCSVNLWFVLSLLHEMTIGKKICVVYPTYLNGNDVWLDFGGATPEMLLSCYQNRIEPTDQELQRAANLWQAYKRDDRSVLKRLSKEPSVCFPYLADVCQAHLQRFADDGGMGRPERAVERILANSPKDFSAVFKAFFQTEGIYGFGDSQVKKIYDRVLQNR